LRSLKTVSLTVAALASAAAMIPASQAFAGNHSGVPTYNKNVCGTRWVKVHIPKTSYYNIYNAPPQQAHSCIAVERNHLDFQITRLTIDNPWGYPNISSGWEEGVYTCSGIRGKCMKYPVEEKHDGLPVTSVSTWQSPGVYNVSYDIWFNKWDTHPHQDNGTEVMIWLAHPGINDSAAIDWYVTIEGIRWGVMTWTAHNRTGVSWHYVAFLAVPQRTGVHRLWLNPFFRNAIAHHLLQSNWWLTAIDFGFELVYGGLHNNVHYYTLSGVR
jgi:hypothetical protein